MENLLSGALGAIVGVLGAFLAAIFAFRKTRDHEAGLARRAYMIEVSGDLAHALVTLYEKLRTVTASELADTAPADVGSFRDAEQDLRRAITVDAPLLGTALEAEMKRVRDALRSVFGPERSQVPVAELRGLIAVIRPAGDELRELRRSTLRDAPSRTANV